MKIAFCTDGIFPEAVGGMQRHSKLLLEALSHYNDLEIDVFHPHETPLFNHCDNINEIVIQGILEEKNYLRECYRYSERIASHLEAADYDVIYSQGLSVWHNHKKFSDKLMINPHGLEPFQAIGAKDKLVAIPFKRVFRKLFRNARKVVSLGGGLTEIIKGIVPAEQIVVLPNATNVPPLVDKEFPDSGGPLKFMFVARFAHNKGIHILMQAIERLNVRIHPEHVV